MAFIYETERSKLFNQNKKNQDIGPGQYLPLTEFKFQNPEIVPFGISTNRQFPEKPLPYPGPGSYYHDVDKEKIEKILKNSLQNYYAKEDEINISKQGIAKFEPERGEQERALKKCKDNHEILGFGSKVKRFFHKNRVITPGPGTYSDKNFREAKSLEKKCYNNKATIFKINADRNSVFQVDKNEVSSLNFNKNVISEKDKNNKKLKKKNAKKEIKKRLEEEQKEIKNKNEVKYRVSSIPSKNNKGYIIEESTGKLVRKKNPEAFKIFSGDKDDAVGPGSYELIFPEDWKKTGTSWSKYKWEKDPKKIRPKSSYNVNNINCEVGNFRKKKNNFENNKVNKEMSNYYKSYTTKQLNYKDPTAHNIDTITEVIKKRKMPSFIPINNVPGPGFYYDSELMDGMRRASARPIIEKKPYNLEDELFNELFNNKNNDKEEGIIYDFKKEQAENFKKKILEKIKQKNIPFLSKSERFNLEPYIKTKSFTSNKNSSSNKKVSYNNNAKKKNLLKGVKVQNNRNTESGSISNEVSYYSSTNNSSTNNIMNLFYSRPQSMSGTFYRKDIRFREREIEENSKKYVPGPGSYINPFTGTGKSNSIQINGRYMDLKTCIKYIENNRFNNLRPKTASHDIKVNNYINFNKNPGVGSYEPEKIYTVKHDMMNKLKQGNKTFNSTLLSDRNAIYQFQKNAPNGPGTYFQNDYSNISVPQNYNGFNITSFRFEKGGKNNTKEVLDEIADNKYRLNAMISTFMTKDDYENNMKNIGDTNRNSNINEYKIKKTKKKSFDKKHKRKKNIGPGTYEYTAERFPWVKPSFNAKYI